MKRYIKNENFILQNDRMHPAENVKKWKYTNSQYIKYIHNNKIKDKKISNPKWKNIG